MPVRAWMGGADGDGAAGEGAGCDNSDRVPGEPDAAVDDIHTGRAAHVFKPAQRP